MKNGATWAAWYVSLRYIKKSSIPGRQTSCGKSDGILEILERLLLIFIWMVWSDRHDLTQPISLAAKKTACSLGTRTLWCILSKASWRSVIIKSMTRPLPNVSNISSLRKDINKSAEWLFWNPGRYLHKLIFLVI